MCDVYRLSSPRFNASVTALGAELWGLQDRDGREYIWQGDPAFWAGHSPTLFPITGKLKDGRYSYQGKTCELPIHGFARRRTFALEERTADSLSLVLEADEETLACYPFHFRLRCRFSLNDSGLSISREAENLDEVPMYCSLGEHLGLNVSAFGPRLEDCWLAFPSPQSVDAWTLSDGGLLLDKAPFLEQADSIPLSRQLFTERGSLLLEGLDAGWVALRGRAAAKGVRVSIGGFPWLVIWSPAGGGDFVCVEPWQGLPDPQQGVSDLSSKPGMIALAPGGRFSYQVRVEPEA